MVISLNTLEVKGKRDLPSKQLNDFDLTFPIWDLYTGNILKRDEVDTDDEQIAL